MCGFLFIHNFIRPITDAEFSNAERASRHLNSRGPDGSAQFRNGHTAAFFYRLSILDPTPNGDQPMSDQRGMLVFNGMIYNYRELRQSLKNLYEPRSTGDTEVLFEMLANKKGEALDEIDGMFAGVFCDFRENKIHFFRDQFGQKPLFYFKDNKRLIVCSELKPIKQLISQNTIDVDACSNFMKFSFFVGDETLVKEIRRTLPGYHFTVNAGSGHMTVRLLAPKADTSHNRPLRTSELAEAFIDSCQYVSSSDFPTALFLSGGVDSSLVLHGLSDIEKPNCLFLRVDDERLDETEKIDLLQKRYNFDLTTVVANKGQTLKSLPSMIAGLDEPHGDPGFLNSYLLAESVGRSTKVIFTGDGADEIFCGYETFKATSIADPIGHILASTGLALSRLWHDSTDRDSFAYMNLNFKLEQYKNGLGKNSWEKFLSWLGNDLDAETIDLSRLAEKLGRDILFSPQTTKQLDDLRQFYLGVFLPEYICAHTDRSLMMRSLEGRSPYLNKRFFSKASTISPNNLYAYGRTKIPLKKLAKSVNLPSKVINSPKVGFTIPLARWFVEDDKFLKPMTMASSLKVDEIIPSLRLIDRIQEHKSMRKNNYRLIYNALVLEGYLNENV